MQFGCSTTERDGPSTTPPEYRTQCGFSPVGGAVWAVGGERPELHAAGDDDARVGACSQPRVCEEAPSTVRRRRESAGRCRRRAGRR